MAKFQTNLTGSAVVTTLGPIKQLLEGNVGIQSQRYLVIVPLEDGVLGMPLQVQIQSQSK